MWFLILSLVALTSLNLGAEPVKPVSVSYDNIIRCFSELSDPVNSFKVDINRLKDLIDKKFATSNSSLRYRRITFKDSSGQLKKILLNRVGESKNYKLTLQKLDEKGDASEMPLSEAQRINPKSSEIANLLLNVNITADEYVYDDTKLKGVSLSYQRVFQDVRQLELSDKTRKRSISCDNQKDFGIICTCSLK